MIGIHDPFLTEADKREVLDALRSNWISGGGAKVAAFEEELRTFFKLPAAPLATVNGSAALILALRALNVRPGEHVLVSDYGFVATANSVRILGAEPIFLGPGNGEFPVVKLSQVENFFSHEVDAQGHFKATGKKIRGMLYNEPYGFACPRLGKIESLLASRGMFLVEDSSQAIGAQIGDSFLGAIGTLGVFSFNGNKTLTTGAGGLLMGRDPLLLAKARKLQHHSRSDSFEFIYDDVGYNFLMPNLLGALGLSQARRLPELLRRKAKIRSAYARFMQDTPLRLAGDSLSFPAWLNVVIFPGIHSDRRAFRELAVRMLDEGVQLRPTFPPVSSYPMYRDSPLFDGARGEEFFGKTICVPSGFTMDEAQAEKVVALLVKKAKELGLC